MCVTMWLVLPLVLLQISIPGTQGVKRMLTAEFTKMEVENLRPEVLSIQYHINRTSSNISAIYVNFTVSQDIDNLSGTFILRMKHSEKFINYANGQIDFCNALQMFYNNYIMQMVSNGIRSVSNYPLECPIKKNRLYYINGFTINKNFIPSYLPTVKFTAESTYIHNGRLSLHLKIFGALLRK